MITVAVYSHLKGKKQINVDNVAYFAAEYKTVAVYCTDKSVWYMYNATLKSIADKVGNRFVRIHNKYLVNVVQSQGIVTETKTSWSMTVNGTKLPVSRRQFVILRQLYSALKCSLLPRK